MVEKNKNSINTPYIENLVSAIGTTAMLAATVFGLVEHMDREGHRLMTALQPAYAANTQSISADAMDTQFRRAGKEEIHHSSATYGSVKRSASVSGAA